ncbi:MAG TPA: crosslink repair DNA glycosylase YcaQ family protein [Pseudonocardiaceae bacterium]|nr:crosslink repair DNA glycosylase YcaQ family protein [Pseudonocardiaceae bacterium]
MDGVVAGTWRHSRERDTATLYLHALRATRARTALRDEGRRLLSFLEPEASRQVVAFD